MLLRIRCQNTCRRHCKGKIIGFNSNEVFVDLGYKADGIIPLEEYTDDPNFNIEKEVKIGEEVEVLVEMVNDGEGNVRLSKRKWMP